MDVKYNIPLKRSSNDFCFYGPKGSGKTIAMSYFALYFYLKGIPICSNYHLNLPHRFISSLDEVAEMRDCVFLGDDFEKWGSSKFLTNREKKMLLECTLNFGKNNIIFIWSCKRPLEIDKTLRASSVDYFVKCSMVLKYEPKSYDDYLNMSRYLDAHIIQMEVYNSIDLSLDRVCYLDDLDLYSSLYDTTEHVTSPTLLKASVGVAANNFTDGEFLPAD